MESKQSETVLISLVGTSPGVLTETVWALANEEEPVIPDRVVAVTTSPGKEALVDRLFTKGGWDALLANLQNQGHDLENKLGFGNIGDAIRVFPDRGRTRELDDIRSVEDNEAVAEYLMETVRGFTENDAVRLVVSIAGGRKTTSALLHSVVTLLGRAQDRITHVIIDDVWIHPDFLYPGCTGTFENRETGETLDSSEARVDLIDVPFIPLRYLFARDLQRPAGSYLQLMERLRTRTLNVEEDLDLNLDTNTGQVTVDDKAIKLSANEFLVYLFFAHRALNEEGPIGSYADIGDDLQSLHKSNHRPNDYGHWTCKALENPLDPSEDIRRWAGGIRAALKTAGFDEFQVDRLVPKRGHLGIQLPKEAITIS